MHTCRPGVVHTHAHRHTLLRTHMQRHNLGMRLSFSLLPLMVLRCSNQGTGVASSAPLPRPPWTVSTSDFISSLHISDSEACRLAVARSRCRRPWIPARRGRRRRTTSCAYVLIVKVVMVTLYLCNSYLSKERAEWEERRGSTAPPRRPRKDIVECHIYLVFLVCLYSVYRSVLMCLMVAFS